MRRMLSAALIAVPAWLLAYAPEVRAQSKEPEPAPAATQREGAPSSSQQTSATSRWFTISLGAVVLVDYSGFRQDPNSLAQVGRQSNTWDDRSLRASVQGTIGRNNPITYLIAYEYQGFATDPENLWELTDVAFTFPIGGRATRLTVGKTKETFVYEMVGDAAFLPQQERVLNPFFRARNVGAKLTQVIGDKQRMTASVGVFNDWLATGHSLANSSTDVSARVTGLVWDQRDGTSFLHLGASGRYVGADNQVLRYKGRPESNVTDLYVDTGDLSADHAWHLGLEGLWNDGPFSVLAEYNGAWVDAPASGHPKFSGYYLTGSLVLTGEARPYDRSVGYTRGVVPNRRWGATELVARMSRVDLDDGPVRGGTFDKTYLGINWWATRRSKMGFGWGHTWLKRFGQTGVTDSFLTRLQWIY